MKLLRIWLLVLAAALLPLRDVAAATMPRACQDAGLQGRQSVHEGMHPHVHTLAMAGHDHAGAGHGASSGGKCRLCAACCGGSAPPSAVAVVAEPAATAAAAFPELNAPAPAFMPDGRERPPRTT